TNSQNATSKGWYVLDRDYQNMPPTTGTFDCSLIGIEDIDVDIVEAKVYPNPAIDKLNIESKEMIQRLEVYDALGRKVFSKIPNQNNFSFDISNLERGIYILKLQTKKGIGSYKIVKQ
ncbi:MAG: T9SS type A sorting domain-containing protein, partial [Bacteroidales bacterium]|nr:T9SS type A sorting domain-containing protein [Bacteroidales bacterium]